MTRSDSSGIEIVSVRPEAFGMLPIWRLTAEPVLTIGQVEGEAPYLFGRIREAVRLSDGRIVVADGYYEDLSGDTRVFDASGVFLASIARSGRGPGEFDTPQLVELLPGDTLGVWDRTLQRVSFLTPDGRLVDEWMAASCPGRLDVEGGTPCFHPAGFLDDGTLIIATNSPICAEGGTIGPKIGQPVTIGRIQDGEWTAVDTLMQGDQFWVLFRRGGAQGVRPYSRMYGGRPYWTANGEFAAYARSDSSDIRLVASEGRLVRIIRWAMEPRPVGDQEIAAYRDYDWGDQRESAETWLQEFEPGTTVPFFGEIRLDDAERLWVEDYHPRYITPPEAPRWWTVFSTDGTPLARMQLPGADSMTVHQIDEGTVLGSVQDDLGVERVVVYGIERGGG